MIRLYLVFFLLVTSYLSLASDQKKTEPVNVKQFSLVKDNGEITKDGNLKKHDNNFVKKSFKVLVLLEVETNGEQNLYLVWKRAGSKYLEENVKIDKKNKKLFTISNINSGDWSIELLDSNKKKLKSIFFSIDHNGDINIKNQMEDKDNNPEGKKTLVQALESLQDPNPQKK
jgi:hypothetical protein